MLSDESTEARLARIETKLDTIVQHLMDDHENRLRSLEKWRYGLPVSLVLAAISVAAAVISMVAVFTRLGVG